MVRMTRMWAMPNKKTFDIMPIANLIHQEIPEIFRVMDAVVEPFPFNYMEDATDYLKRIKPRPYGLFDPPYSPRQLKECYNNKGEYDTKASTWSKWKDLMSDKVEEKCISFGWSSVGLGINRGMK